MSTMLEYTGYLGSAGYSDEGEMFHGRLEFLRDLMTYEGTDTKSLKQAFHEAVDDYLALCAGEGRKPDSYYRSRAASSQPRTAPAGHGIGTPPGISLNAVVSNAIRRHLDRDD